MSITFDEDSAELFLASETQWDSEPTLTQEQQHFLISHATASEDIWTIESVGAMVYLGLRWKYKKAIETYLDGEDKIFEHLKQALDRWSMYADVSIGFDANALQLIELEVGANFG